jgi:hypothetical protein
VTRITLQSVGKIGTVPIYQYKSMVIVCLDDIPESHKVQFIESMYGSTVPYIKEVPSAVYASDYIYFLKSLNWL